MLTKTTYQGSTTSYVYNAANRLVYLRNPDYLEVDYQYDPAGRLLSRVTSAGARTLYHYLDNGVLQQLDQYNAAGTQISGTVFTRDRVGNILTRQDGSTTVSYGYDALYRLRTADHPVPPLDESYTYDKVGNRKTVTLGSLTANSNTRYYNYVSGSNRLTNIRIGSVSGTLESGFTFDNEGRLTAQTGAGARTLTWDAKGRMKTLLQSAVTETYSYDPTDHRVGRSGGALGSLNYFLEGEHLESIYKGTTLEAKYLRGSSIDELVAGYLKDTDNKLKPYIFHQDNLTSTSAVSGHNGTVHQSIQYTAFGNVRINSGTSPNRLKYTGREDDNTGLYYYRARYYDPQIGRFLSEDKIGFAGGINQYAYVGNNPINANDPSGHCGPLTPLCIAALIGGGTSVAAGGAIRGGVAAYQGEDISSAVFDPGAIAVDALLGATIGGTVATITARTAVAGKSSVELGFMGDQLARQTLAKEGTDILAEQVYLRIPGTYRTPIVDFVTGGETSLVGVEAKMSGSLLNPEWTYQPAQKIGYSLIDDGAVASLFGKSATNANLAGESLGQMKYLEYTGWDTVSLFGAASYSAIGSSAYNASGGFLLYPNKSNTNFSQSVYSK